MNNEKAIKNFQKELYKSYYNMAKENRWAFFRSKQTSVCST